MATSFVCYSIFGIFSAFTYAFALFKYFSSPDSKWLKNTMHYQICFRWKSTQNVKNIFPNYSKNNKIAFDKEYVYTLTKILNSLEYDKELWSRLQGTWNENYELKNFTK